MKTLSKLAVAASIGILSISASAGSLNGTKWQTIDEKSGTKKSVVQFTEKAGVTSGKIIELNDTAKKGATCKKCKGNLKDQKIEGMRILWGLKAKDANKWVDGSVLNPEDGKTYTGSVTLGKDGKTLKLKGCAAKVFCRSQTWKKIN